MLKNLNRTCYFILLLVAYFVACMLHCFPISGAAGFFSFVGYAIYSYFMSWVIDKIVIGILGCGILDLFDS